MPLPSTQLTLNGGCNCRAIRYQIRIPALNERPLHPGSILAGGEDVRLPLVATDHCNDCRKATGSVLPLWILTPMAFVSGSVRTPDPTVTDAATSAAPGTDGDERGDADSEAAVSRGPEVPGTELFTRTPANQSARAKFPVTFYQSSPNVTRSFCGRCGTSLAYWYQPLPAGWPVVIDIVLGTVDREDLEGEWMRPERHMWWTKGIGWVKELVGGAGGCDLPRHPRYMVNESV